MVFLFYCLKGGTYMKKLLLMSAFIVMLAGCGTSNANTDTLTVGLECNYAPFNWTQANSSDTAIQIEGGGYCDGYDIAIATKIADAMGKELVVKKVSWDGLPLALQSGSIDMIVAGMTETAERAQVIDFTEPYYTSNLVMVVRNDSIYKNATSVNEFANANVVAQKGTFHVDLVSQIPNVKAATPMNSFPEMTVATSTGAVDALIAEFPVAQAIVQANPNLVIVEFAQNQGFTYDQADVTVSVAVQKGNSALKEQINQVLAGLDENARKQIMVDAIARQPEQE